MSAHTRQGILPDEVIRDPQAEGAILLIRLLDPNIPLDEVKAWLADLGELINSVEQPDPANGDRPTASLVLGLSPAFFARFPEQAANVPAGFSQLPTLPCPTVPADAIIYATVTAEYRVSQLLEALDADPRVDYEVERAARTQGDREVFAQRDGLRNVPRHQRHRCVFVDVDEQPEEPAWVDHGSYGAYLKIQQDTAAWATIDAATREQMLGRRADGSRIDLPPGTEARTEPAFSDPQHPPPTCHIRKAGPRGPLHEDVMIFRRGMPYTQPGGGTATRGLQFISFQNDLVSFDVVLNDWMLNADFPRRGVGPDALHPLTQYLHGGLFLVPPDDDRFPAAGFFDPPPKRTKRKGKIVVHKRVVDTAGNPVRAERGGLVFQILNQATGEELVPPITTNSGGRAVSKSIRVNTAVIVREAPHPLFQPQPDVEATIVGGANPIVVTNTLRPEVSPYGQPG